jgi:exonuclease III
MKRTLSTSIAIACWNIDGLHYRLDNTSTRYSKLKDESILKSLQNHDIICLVETHCNYTDTIDLDGYSTVMNIRPKSPKATKHSGGIAIVIKNTIRPGITFLPITNSRISMVQIRQEFL